MGDYLMGDSESEYLEKIDKIKRKSSERVTEVLDQFGKAQRLKAEALKKNEEMMTSAASDLEKLERDMARDKEISPESENKINEEILEARNIVRQKYDELRARISDRLQ